MPLLEVRCPACGKRQDLAPTGEAACKRCAASLRPLRDLVRASHQHRARAVAALKAGEMETAHRHSTQAYELDPSGDNRRLVRLAHCLQMAREG